MSSHGVSAGSAGDASGHDDGSSGGACGSSGFKVYGSVFKVDARYEFLNPLGKGSYGIVCAAKDRDTGQRVAIKKVCPMAKRSVDAMHTLREVLLLQLLGKHPNVISVHNLSTNLKDDELYIMMDLMDTDLHRVIQSSQTLSESHVKYFLHQLLRGVKYLHDNGVLHRDLKPGNLLLSKTCQLKIADFGLARKASRPSGVSSTPTFAAASGLERPRSAPATSTASSSSRGAPDRAPMTEHVVTRWYRAPELMLQPDGFYDESVDMWSVGCIFAEILGRKAFFPGKNFLHQLTLIFDVIGTPPADAAVKIKSSQAQRFLKSLGRRPKVPLRTVFPGASDEALDLLERLLEFDPEKRISAHDALAHPYMQPIEKKYKGVDPHPSARVDFSFDSKKLTKMDLRALLIKEVESFRRSVAHAAAVDTELAVELTKAAASTTTKQPVERETKRLASASAAATLSAASAHGRVMCGSAGISMINSTLRQRLESEAADGRDGGGSVSKQTPVPTSTAAASVAIGSSRARIRMATKPPVPKQQAALGGVPAEPQGHDSHRPVPAKIAASIALSTLEQRSKMLMSTGVGGNGAWAAPVASLTLGGNTVSGATRPEMSKSPASPAQSSSSSSSSEEGGTDRPLVAPRGGNLTARVDGAGEPISQGLPRRRVASAGAVRPKPTTTAASTHKPVTRAAHAPPTAFVGSTTSLIRAQRLNKGQSLADTADETVATMAQGKRDLTPTVDTRDREQREELGDQSEATLRQQRSTTQLNQQEGGAKKSIRKLTVPKSPKFSVMSWQKKRETKAARAAVDPVGGHVVSRR